MVLNFFIQYPFFWSPIAVERCPLMAVPDARGCEAQWPYGQMLGVETVRGRNKRPQCWTELRPSLGYY
jgi:hypothetical protein